MEAAGSMPEVCARLCPQESLCEKACTAESEGGPIAVGALMRFAADQALDRADAAAPHPVRTLARHHRFAVVGSGPAGLACADVLARRGHHVTVFEAGAKAGGLLSKGIPSFKIEPGVVERRIRMLEAEGVEFRLNAAVGETVPASELIGFDAVLLACGAQKPRPFALAEDLRREGASVGGIMDALTFLLAAERFASGHADKVDRADVQPEAQALLRAAGSRVVVLGGGGTAVDAARTALRLGASEAVCLVRRSAAELRVPKADVEQALAEGVVFEFESQVEKILVKNGRAAAESAVTGVRVRRADGRTRTMPCRFIVHAFGFEKSFEPWMAELGVKPDDLACRGEEADGRTANPKVFSAGDLLRGPSLVVNAVADGRRAAERMLDAADPKRLAAKAPKRIRKL